MYYYLFCQQNIIFVTRYSKNIAIFPGLFCTPTHPIINCNLKSSKAAGLILAFYNQHYIKNIDPFFIQNLYKMRSVEVELCSYITSHPWL